jgi:hypothetical protein
MNMTNHEYLERILTDQTLAEDGPELKALRLEREAVEELLREEFQPCNPTIRYGGSKAKGTMIREMYDLDIPCYFDRDDQDAGGTLEDIFHKTEKALGKKYKVQPKTSVLRLLSSQDENRGIYTHVDVVPGRFIDDSNEDCFLYINGGEKCRLRTNIETQINYIRDSGRRPAIRLAKLWRVRSGLQIKTFGLELSVIQILASRKIGNDLDDQLIEFWKTWRDESRGIRIEDPANPSGNDLGNLLTDQIRLSLSIAAANSLRLVENNGWEAMFGKPREEGFVSRTKTIASAASAYGSRGTKPWLDVR